MVRIIADSTCDLPVDIARNLGISIVPLHIVLGEKEYRDGIEIHPGEIFDWCDENKTTPKTSAVSYEDATDVLSPFAKSGEEAIVFVISESMSTTGNVFRMAIEDLEASDRIFVFDSQNLSVGIGLLAIQACEMAQEGLTAKEILCKLEAIRGKVRSSFVVDSLTYLARGGRCSAATALAGGVLKIHPKIVVKDGVMEADKRYRGQMRSVIMDYVQDLKEELLQAESNRVFLVFAGDENEITDEVYEYLQELGYFEEIEKACAGGVISSHCGPGTVGVMYIAK